MIIRVWSNGNDAVIELVADTNIDRKVLSRFNLGRTFYTRQQGEVLKVQVASTSGENNRTVFSIIEAPKKMRFRSMMQSAKIEFEFNVLVPIFIGF